MKKAEAKDTIQHINREMQRIQTAVAEIMETFGQFDGEDGIDDSRALNETLVHLHHVSTQLAVHCRGPESSAWMLDAPEDQVADGHVDLDALAAELNNDC